MERQLCFSCAPAVVERGTWWVINISRVCLRAQQSFGFSRCSYVQTPLLMPVCLLSACVSECFVEVVLSIYGMQNHIAVFFIQTSNDPQKQLLSYQSALFLSTVGPFFCFCFFFKIRLNILTLVFYGSSKYLIDVVCECNI